jgi:hypothetical protein
MPFTSLWDTFALQGMPSSLVARAHLWPAFTCFPSPSMADLSDPSLACLPTVQLRAPCNSVCHSSGGIRAMHGLMVCLYQLQAPWWHALTTTWHAIGVKACHEVDGRWGGRRKGMPWRVEGMICLPSPLGHTSTHRGMPSKPFPASPHLPWHTFQTL